MPGGAISGYAIYRDITKRKEAEEALRALRQVCDAVIPLPNDVLLQEAADNETVLGAAQAVRWRLLDDKTRTGALAANESSALSLALTRETGDKDRAWAFLHTPLESAPFDGDSPLYFMLENGLQALREVARLLVREQRTPVG